MELTSILNESLTYISSSALRCAVELDIPNHIQAYGHPMPLDKLARSIAIPPEKDTMLGRLMALLVEKEVFAQNENGYVLMPISKLILSDGSNMGAYVRFVTSLQITKPYFVLSEWFKDDSRGRALPIADDGMQFWDISQKNPEIANLFNEAMAGMTRKMMRDFVAIYPLIFDGLDSLVDVGGGTGSAVKIIADAFPLLRCTVLDLPHVIAKALKDDSFNVIAGDMFEKIPPADAILLKNILHNWCDEDCVRILDRCKEAIEPKKNGGGKVIVVDIVLDLANTVNPKEKETALMFDVAMMCGFASKERNKQEWHDLFMAAGYSSYKIYPTRLGVASVMELYP